MPSDPPTPLAQGAAAAPPAQQGLGPGRIMRLVKVYLVALFVVFLHFAGQFKAMSVRWNRRMFLWDRHHAIARVLDLFLIALLFTLLAQGLVRLARRWGLPRLRRSLGHLFLIAVASGVLAAFPSFSRQNHATLTKLIWLGIMLGVGYSLGSGSWKPVRYAFNFCLLFSPVVFIFSAQMLSWPPWQDPPKTNFAVRRAPGPRAPVFLFIFDEWSRPRSMTADAQFRTFFKNLRKMCGQSVVFPHGRSPAGDTDWSIPRMIQQTDLRPLTGDGLMCWKDGDKIIPMVQLPSLFQLARDHGYNGYVLGWYLPYNRMLGEQVDYCHVRRARSQGDSILSDMGHALLYNLKYWTDPVSRRIEAPVRRAQSLAFLRRQSIQQRQEILDVLRDCPTNSFALFHLMLPHRPFMWNEDGSYREPTAESASAGYERNLKCLDHYVGQVVAQLRAAGKFDDALIILTSDHSWRSDPEPQMHQEKDADRCVPLIIKLPGQKTGAVIEDPLVTNQLKPFFEAVFAGERDPQRLLQILRRLAAQPPP